MVDVVVIETVIMRAFVMMGSCEWKTIVTGTIIHKYS